MTAQLHIADEDLTLYAAGSLSPEEMEKTAAHLRLCARCMEEVRQNMLALAAYAQTTPETALPEGAKGRFMAKLAETPQGENAAPVQQVEPVKEEKVGFWRAAFGTGPWQAALTGAMAILLVGVGLDDLQRRAQMVPLLKEAQKGEIDSVQLNQLMELLTSPKAQRVALHPGTVTNAPPEGRVVYAARTGKLLLTASNLSPLPAGKTYELWILQPGGKQPLPAGTFAPDSTGNAAMILADVPAGLAVQGFGVTIENAGGSQTPTLPIVLSGL